MDMSKLETIFYNCKQPSTVSSDLLCVFCRKIIINAQQAPCGCRFCKKCVDSCLEEKVKYCPGNEEECKMFELSRTTQFQVDNYINRRILKLMVTCPNADCNYECELKSMENHIRLCGKDTAMCTYSTLGCTNADANHDDHTDLLLNSIGNLVNDVMHLKMMVDKQNIEIDKLKKSNDELVQINRNLGQFSSLPFVWRVDDFSNKHKKRNCFYSDSFYSHHNGYKMRLLVHPYGIQKYIGKNLFVGFHILHGDFDEILEWPFKHQICLSLLNLDTREPNRIFTFKYDAIGPSFKKNFLKPPENGEHGLGDDEFISFEELFSSSDILRNNTIFIKCSVNFL